jgi:hypothetical protein
VFSTVNLLGIYHDTILTKHVASLPAAHRPAPSALNRYTRDWQNSSPIYKRIVLVLTFIQYTEVLIEMSIQKKWGQQYKWRVITALEAIKYVNGCFHHYFLLSALTGYAKGLVRLEAQFFNHLCYTPMIRVLAVTKMN